MKDLTGIVRPLFERRVAQWRRLLGREEAVQRQELRGLLLRGRATSVGARYGFGAIGSYEEYCRRVPVVEYPAIRPLVERMLRGEANVMWPGRVASFAQSSGTADGKSKYIPVTAEGLRRNHYRGGFDVVAHYLASHPGSRLFSGKAFILGGSFANELTGLPRGIKVGDLSATLIDRINPLVELLRVPSKRVALMADWREKLPRLVEASMGQDITNISGVPSWFLTVIKAVMERRGAATIHQVWPHLEVFFHGGISFAPYREQYARLADPTRMSYWESYNASEGFFGVQTDPGERGVMSLLLDAGVFYEFVPLEQVGEAFPEAATAWTVEEGSTYALVVTTCNGLWRYALGDTVTIERRAPLGVSIAGRTRSYINAFGEELMVHNAEAAVARACRQLGCAVANYTAAPVYAGDRSRGRHQWLVEFAQAPRSVEEWADALDRALQQENSDYQAKRAGGIFLDRLEVVVARPGLFDRWLAATGKLGGQRKVPRLANDRRAIDQMLALNQQLA